MTPTLRTWHRLIWPLLAVILITLGFFALQVFPGTSYIPQPVSLIGGSNGITAQLQAASGATPATVELHLTAPLNAATTLVYLASKPTDQPANAQLLGRIEGRGTHRFPLNPQTAAFKEKHLFGFDPIYKQPIFQIQLDQ
ncbi:MAG: hypothetical protein AAGG75_22490 [Bacteroidota bacterium]